MADTPVEQLAIFELEPWERAYLSPRLSDLDVYYSTDRIDGTASVEGERAQVLSVFIHSRLDRQTLSRFPDLRMIATRSTGFDHIDLEACDERGIVVSNVPYYGENTVAEHTFALILALSRNVVRAYERTIRSDFRLEGLQGFDLKRKTLGVIGAGSIGLHVIRIARGFDMRVVAFDLQENRLLAEVLGFDYVPLDRLLRESDIVSLHAPSTSHNHHLIGRDSLMRMKRGSLLINTARGALVDTEALIWALDEGILAGAGLDVIEGEEYISEERQLLSDSGAEEKLRMLVRQHVLLRRPDVVVTPHIAFYSREALRRIADTSIENIRAFIDGQPKHVVNHPGS